MSVSNSKKLYWCRGRKRITIRPISASKIAQAVPGSVLIIIPANSVQEARIAYEYFLHFAGK